MKRIRGISQGSVLGGVRGISLPVGGFSPSNISGLIWFLDSRADNVNTEAAANFNGSNSLSSSSSDFDFNESSFSIAGWINLPSLASNHYHFTKWTSSGNQRAFSITTNTSGDLRFFISNDGSATSSTTTSPTTLTTGTWYFIAAVFDYDNSLAKISVNAETFTTSAETNIYSSNASFLINSINAANENSGTYDLLGIYDKALSQAEVTSLYNSGNAIAYNNLSGSLLTNLISWYSLSEKSGTRYDQHGSNNLTDNNSTGSAAGVLDEKVVDNAPVNNLIDKSTSTNDVTQNVFVNQPIWDDNGLNSNPCVDFVDASDYMSSDNPVFNGLAQFTLITWGNYDSAASISYVLRERTSDGGSNFFRVFTAINTSGFARVSVRPTSTGTSVTLISTTNVDATDTVITGVFDSVNDAHELFIDNVSEDTDTTALPAIENVNPANAETTNLNDPLSGVSTGRHGGVLLYNKVLSATERTNVHTWINGIWGI